MTDYRLSRARARRWAARHDFPWRRTLLVEQHRLPSRRLARLVDALLLGSGEEVTDVVEVAPDVRLEVDLRSMAQRSVAYGLSDEAELDLLHTILRRGDVVVDVGANIGLYTLVAARRVGPEGIVFAFEPNPATLARLRRNVELNHLANIVVEGAAVSDRRGTAVLRSPDRREPGLATIVGEGGALAEVETVTLDAGSSVSGVGQIALLKVDAEGAEAAVLRGAGGMLHAGVIDRVLVEVLDGSTEPQRILADLGWEIAVVRGPGEKGPLVRPCQPDDRFRYANLLCSRLDRGS